MNAMWFVGVRIDTGSKIAIAESDVKTVSIHEDGLRVAFCEPNGKISVFGLDTPTVRCVNSSEMLRFMRGEEVKP
jgi:hypothetical protein